MAHLSGIQTEHDRLKWIRLEARFYEFSLKN